VLLTSAHEGWPNIVKEALACNVPFVSTDVSDLRSIAEVDATCHVADATPEALAHYLLQTLQAGRPQTLRRHVEDMALPITAEKLVRLYERVVAITG
jgi:glycosyltransferase involved in cell wall biosynthesis